MTRENKQANDIVLKSEIHEINRGWHGSLVRYMSHAERVP